MASQRLPPQLAVAITLSGTAQDGTEIRDLIRQMSLANPLWGAPRIHGELLKLGIEVSQATVARYMP
jgi:arginine repressor